VSVTEEHERLVELAAWIDHQTSGLWLPADERSMLVVGCFDVALEHQAAIALLYTSSLFGSGLALLRVLTESLVRGLWLLHCASPSELEQFKRGKVTKTFATLVSEVEAAIQDVNGVLSGFKATAWDGLNGFTHTGMHQVSRRHSPGKVEANYAPEELAKALGVAGALGLIAANQLAAMSDRQDLLPAFASRMSEYARLSGRADR
jgi:hypothetical protein